VLKCTIFTKNCHSTKVKYCERLPPTRRAFYEISVPSLKATLRNFYLFLSRAYGSSTLAQTVRTSLFRFSCAFVSISIFLLSLFLGLRGLTPKKWSTQTTKISIKWQISSFFYNGRRCAQIVTLYILLYIESRNSKKSSLPVYFDYFCKSVETIVISTDFIVPSLLIVSFKLKDVPKAYWLHYWPILICLTFVVL